MSHQLTPAEINTRALNYKTTQPPVPTFWQLDLNDYQIPRETVSIRITPAVRIEKDGAMIDSPDAKRWSTGWACCFNTPHCSTR